MNNTDNIQRPEVQTSTRAFIQKTNTADEKVRDHAEDEIWNTDFILMFYLRLLLKQLKLNYNYFWVAIVSTHIHSSALHKINHSHINTLTYTHSG